MMIKNIMSAAVVLTLTISNYFNKLPFIDLSLSLPTIKTINYNYLHQHFIEYFSPVIRVSFTSAAGVVTVTIQDLSVIFQLYN